MPIKDKTKLYLAQEAHRQENKRLAMDYLAVHPCVDCGETDLVVLEFDHQRDKSFEVGRAISSSCRSWARILQEIAKCEVRCANCHRRKTAKQQGNYRASVA